MVETVVAELGGLHIAVNNAGINKNSAAEDTTEQDWDLTFDLNTKGVFLCCQVCSITFVVVVLQLPCWSRRTYSCSAEYHSRLNAMS